MKFGGTSVKDSEAIERVIGILKSKLPKKVVVVVSALSKVTDTLTQTATLAAAGKYSEAMELVLELLKRHLHMIDRLFGENLKLKGEAVSITNQYFYKLEEYIKVVSVIEELSDLSLAKILAFGELLSSNIIYRAMVNAGLATRYSDARTIIITNSDFLKGEPNIEIIASKVKELVDREFISNDFIITQGFISGTVDGKDAILGRGGSDYTAALIGRAGGATEIEIWTDVDGIHTTDPRMISKAKSISVMSFNEAAELSFFGAKVLHPATIQPAVEKGIPIRVLNSLKPEQRGTLILMDDQVESSGVRAISFKESVTVVNIFSLKMLHSSGFLNRIFEIFGKYSTSVDIVSTSEVNVSLTVDSANSSRLPKIIEELSLFAKVSVMEDKAQISVVGKNLKEIKGLVERVFGAISDYNITMISQGSSNVNISFVIFRNELTNVVRCLHKEFFE
ncbi:MAG: aspartate kinase [Bacteroidales bacterium]